MQMFIVYALLYYTTHTWFAISVDKVNSWINQKDVLQIAVLTNWSRHCAWLEHILTGNLWREILKEINSARNCIHSVHVHSQFNSYTMAVWIYLNGIVQCGRRTQNNWVLVSQAIFNNQKLSLLCRRSYIFSLFWICLCSARFPLKVENISFYVAQLQLQCTCVLSPLLISIVCV